MKELFSRIKESIMGRSYDEAGPAQPDFVEIQGPASDQRGKVVIRTFNLEDFDGIKPVCDALREGRSIVLLNIRPLRDKDMMELKRAIGKLKKTVDALEGEVAGFSEDLIIVTPAFATIHKTQETSNITE